MFCCLGRSSTHLSSGWERDWWSRRNTVNLNQPRVPASVGPAATWLHGTAQFPLLFVKEQMLHVKYIRAMMFIFGTKNDGRRLTELKQTNISSPRNSLLPALQVK